MKASRAAEAHPFVVPARVIFGAVGIVVDPVALVVMGGGIRYVDATGDDVGGFDAAFDLFESAGFNCEQFRSVDPFQFLRAARREYAVSALRWRAVPMWSLRRERAGCPVPVALSDFTDDSVRVRSTAGDRYMGFDELVSHAMPVWGYAAPGFSLRAITSPAAFDVDARATRALRILRNRMSVARDGLPRLEAFIAASPTRGDLDLCRRHMAESCAGDPGFARGVLADAIGRFYKGAGARDDFAASADLHAAFLDGDDAALSEIALLERHALKAEQWVVREDAV
jgi:hypothetical protein